LRERGHNSEDTRVIKGNIFSLRQIKINLASQMRSLLSVDRDLTAAELVACEEIKAKSAENEAQIIRAEALLEQERGMVGLPDENAAFARAAGAHNPNAGFETSLSRTPGSGRGFANLFGAAGQRSTNGFQSLGEFLKSFHSADRMFDPRLRAASGTNVEGVPSDGGFLVPQEYAQEILMRAVEQSIVMSRAQQWPMTSDVKKIPGVDTFDHSASIGGFVATWTPEATDMTAQKLASFLIQLSASKLAIIGKVSNELLDDAVQSFESVYGASLISACSWFLDLAFLSGDGVGKPLGVLHDPALIVVPKEDGTHEDFGDLTQGAGTFIFANAARMYGRLHPACFDKAIWIVNSTLVPQLMSMTFTSLSSTDGLRAPAVQQAADGTLRLFTRPVIATEKLSAAGAQGDVLLVDLSQYAIGMRRSMALDKSQHLGFASDTTYFRVICRADGQGTWRQAMVPKNGDSLSWAVTLAAR
jgi:HK97 family phage major capsid protein